MRKIYHINAGTNRFNICNDYAIDECSDKLHYKDKKKESNIPSNVLVLADVDGTIVNLTDELTLDGNVAHDVDVVIDRLTVEPTNHSRIAESIMQALQLGQGVCSVLNLETDEEHLFSMHAYSPRSGLSYSSCQAYIINRNYFIPRVSKILSKIKKGPDPV